MCGSYFSEARIGGQTRDGIEKVEICVILTLMPETGIGGIKIKSVFIILSIITRQSLQAPWKVLPRPASIPAANCAHTRTKSTC